MIISPIDLTKKLIGFRTINPPGNERPCAEFLSDLLMGAGFHTELLPYKDGRAQLVARIGGSDRQLPLCFTGHLDTVPLGMQPWSVDPFEEPISEGKLFGRGSSDMKSGVAAFVSASVELADQLADTPGIVLVITADEEVGCVGAFDLARQPDKLGNAGAIVVAEPTGNMPLVGHKGALWLMAKTQGVTAHGSMPEKGVNALYRAAKAITALEDFDFNIARHPVMGSPTLNVGTAHGGLNVNSVPDRAEIGIDIRTIPGQAHARILESLQSYLGPGVSFDILIDVGSVWTDPDVPWMRRVFETASSASGETSVVGTAPYFTDASALTPAMGSPPTVILGPGELVQAHQTDEYCSVERVQIASKMYKALIRDWCSI